MTKDQATVFQASTEQAKLKLIDYRTLGLARIIAVKPRYGSSPPVVAAVSLAKNIKNKMAVDHI